MENFGYFPTRDLSEAQPTISAIDPMQKKTKEMTRKRGRPFVGGRERFVGIRLSPELIARIDRWGVDHQLPSRSQAVRHVLEEGLQSRGY
jgi:hypothetical protein